jgi:lipopolysaccharide export system protein LptA
MYAPSSRRINTGHSLLLLLLVLAVPQPARTLTTDQEQAIEIEADTGELDDARNTNTYTGAVIVTQGSIRITGDKMTVYYNENNDIEALIMEGRPATYRQLPDASAVHDEAQAQRMEYHKQKNLVILIDRAQVKQAGGSLSGDRIEYDTLHSRVKVTSAPDSTEDGARPGPAPRVKIVIPARPD